MHKPGIAEKASTIVLVAVIVVSLPAGSALFGGVTAQTTNDTTLLWEHSKHSSDVTPRDTAAADGRVFSVDSANQLIAVNATDGSSIWQTSPHSSGNGIMSVDANSNYVASVDFDEKLVISDAQTGNVEWSTSVSATSTPDVSIYDGTVYVAGDGVDAFDLETGNKEMDISGSSGTDAVSANADGIFTGQDDTIVRYSLSGTQDWQKTYSGANWYKRMHVENGVVVAGDIGNNQVYTLDAETGDEKWSVSAGDADVRISGKSVYVSEGSGDVTAYDRSDGTSIWTQSEARNQAAGLSAIKDKIYWLEEDATLVGAGQVIAVQDNRYTPAGASISGTVNDTDGDGIANAKITAQNPQTGATFETTTDSNGHYSVGVDEGDYFVTADNGVDSEQQTVSVDTDEQLSGVDFELVGAEGIRGEVRNENGDALNNINITATSATGGGTYKTQTDILGQYSLELPPGDYFVSAEGPLGTEQQTVTVPDGEIVENVNFVLPVSASISGQVFDRNGDPLENADVTADPAGNDNLTTVSTSTNESGYYQLFMENGSYNVTASYQSASETKNITLDPQQSLSGENFYLDTSPFDPGTLVIDAPKRLNHSATGEFTITWTNDTSGKDVTDQVALQTTDGELITIDNINNKITATSNTSEIGRATVNATYTVRGQQVNGSAIVVVAPQEVEYIEVLPTLDRFAATMTDNSFFTILASTLLAAAVVPLAGAFSGLAVGTGAMALFWLMGFQSLGMAFLSFFTASFIGLNLAANIDYQVRR